MPTVEPEAKTLARPFFFFFSPFESILVTAPPRIHLKPHLLLYLPNSRDRARFNSDGIFDFIITIRRKFDAAICASSLWSSSGGGPGSARATLSFYPSLPTSLTFNINYKERKSFLRRFTPPVIFFDGDPHRTVTGDGRLWCARDSPTRKGLSVLHKEPAEHRGQTRQAEKLPRLI